MIYLLAEPQKAVLEKIYSGTFTAPKINHLFENTDMASLKDSGPILITDAQASLADYKEILQTHSGLLITSAHPQQQIIQHLRHILIVYFNTEQQGIFRYYDPYIASYFFPPLNEQETTQWLGPIHNLEWYNIDWRNRINSPDQWQQKTNPKASEYRADPAKLTSKPALSNNQKLTLQDMQEEKAAYHWYIENQAQLSQSNITIDTLIYWVKQGIRDGFAGKQQLNQYLSVRVQYPKASPPRQWPSQMLENKLIYLEYYLSKAAG